MRTTKVLAILALACFAACSVEVASALQGAAGLGITDDALMASLYDGGDGHLASAEKQRSLLTTGYGAGYGAPSYPPTYCPNSQIKPVFTAKVAVLMVGTKRHGKTINSGHYVKLIQKCLAKRFRRYNRKYRLNLGFTIRQNTNAQLRRGIQKWFYYEVQFTVGNCGKYKLPLVTQLRGDIQPSARYIKRIRIQSYPYKQK